MFSTDKFTVIFVLSTALFLWKIFSFYFVNGGALSVSNFLVALVLSCCCIIIFEMFSFTLCFRFQIAMLYKVGGVSLRENIKRIGTVCRYLLFFFLLLSFLLCLRMIIRYFSYFKHGIYKPGVLKQSDKRVFFFFVLFFYYYFHQFINPG